MQFDALLIGCGRIGGTLDLDSDRVLTWAKALHRDPQARFAVYDADRDKAELLARHYDVRALESLSEADLASFDVVIIASPTETHREMVRMAMEADVQLIVCEKPVAASVEDLDDLERAYAGFGGRIMVNFHRRFQPGFAELRRRIAQIEAAEKCTSIVVKYQRGFHNNASHALDLLEFLFDRRIPLQGSVVTRAVCDEFDTDPTMTAITRWEEAQICWIGLSGLRASHLEIEIFFERSAIFLLNGGDIVRYMTAEPRQDGYYPAFALASEQTGVMGDWLANVLNHVKLMLGNRALPDNFIQSIDISRRILNLQKAATCQT
jgi:predicted dehydrogenase